MLRGQNSWDYWKVFFHIKNFFEVECHISKKLDGSFSSCGRDFLTEYGNTDAAEEFLYDVVED